FESSSSESLPVTVNPVPTSIAVSASSAALAYGQSVTLTATVTTPAGDLVPASSDGTVTFYDGATVLGTATLSGSPATATLTTTLALGPNTITAAYSGDSDFAASQSGTTPTSAQTVVPATGLTNPVGVAVDGSGDVFIADAGGSGGLNVGSPPPSQV